MPTLTGRFDEAFVYAHQVHGDHTRKGNGFPYIGHLMGVTSIVIDDGGTEDEAIARSSARWVTEIGRCAEGARACVRDARFPAWSGAGRRSGSSPTGGSRAGFPWLFGETESG